MIAGTGYFYGLYYGYYYTTNVITIMVLKNATNGGIDTRTHTFEDGETADTIWESIEVTGNILGKIRMNRNSVMSHVDTISGLYSVLGVGIYYERLVDHD